MLGVLVNTAAVLAGGTLGLLLKRGIPEKISDTLMKGIALCTICIGIAGVIKGENTLIMILSVVLGGLIGGLLNLDGLLNRFSQFLEKKVQGKQKKNGGVSIAQGFISGSLLFCVGAMTIVGSLNAGLSGDNEMLYAKSLLDLISSCVLAATLGAGVLFSAAFVLLFQGAIALAASFAAPYLADSVITEMTCAGSVLILGLGLNLLHITDIKVANYLPAVFLPILLCLFL